MKKYVCQLNLILDKKIFKMHKIVNNFGNLIFKMYKKENVKKEISVKYRQFAC